MFFDADMLAKINFRCYDQFVECMGQGKTPTVEFWLPTHQARCAGSPCHSSKLANEAAKILCLVANNGLNRHCVYFNANTRVLCAFYLYLRRGTLRCL